MSVLSDHLFVPNGFYRPNTPGTQATDMDYIRGNDFFLEFNFAIISRLLLGSYFCGVGLGRDATLTGTTTNADGTDERDGVIIRGNGPFIIR